MSAKLLEMRSQVPVDFARKPRSLRELDRWKATEFRQFLLYTGPVMLGAYLDGNLYKNFTLFFSGIAILISPTLSCYAKYAHTLLRSFVSHFGEIYGKDQIVYWASCKWIVSESSGMVRWPVTNGQLSFQLGTIYFF